MGRSRHRVILLLVSHFLESRGGARR
jgi:hypothetical protein